MNKPTLTIGIPTYNHGHFLKECLACVTGQFAGQGIFDRVEIVVSDNGSIDNTADVVREYQKRFSNIRYSRNERNLEFDRNVDAVLPMARGQFCWTLSSNEYLKPGSIAFVLSAIEQNRDAAFLCISNRREDIGKSELRRFANGSQWLKDMGLFGGQISQCVFNMEYLPSERAKYYDNFWIHLSLFWEAAIRHPVVLLPCLFALPDVVPVCKWAWDRGGGQNLMTYVYLKKNVEGLLRLGYTYEVVDPIVSGLAKGLPRMVASARLCGLPIEWNRFFLLVREFYRYPLYLLASLVIFVVPVMALRMVKKYS